MNTINAKTIYEIVANSRWGNEVVDETDNEKDAEYLKREYQMAFGREFTISIKEREI